jgi:hypothetical protein
VSEGLTPEQVIELKHSLAGMAELVRGYFQDLRGQGFTEEQALRLTIAWQTAISRGREEA